MQRSFGVFALSVLALLSHTKADDTCKSNGVDNDKADPDEWCSTNCDGKVGCDKEFRCHEWCTGACTCVTEAPTPAPDGGDPTPAPAPELSPVPPSCQSMNRDNKPDSWCRKKCDRMEKGGFRCHGFCSTICSAPCMCNIAPTPKPTEAPDCGSLGMRMNGKKKGNGWCKKHCRPSGDKQKCKKNCAKYCNTMCPCVGCSSKMKDDMKGDKFCAKNCHRAAVDHTTCGEKCAGVCGCPMVTADSPKFRFMGEDKMGGDKMTSKKCSWAAKDVSTRCAMMGSFGEGGEEVSANKACPETCGGRRLSYV